MTSKNTGRRLVATVIIAWHASLIFPRRQSPRDAPPTLPRARFASWILSSSGFWRFLPQRSAVWLQFVICLYFYVLFLSSKFIFVVFLSSLTWAANSRKECTLVSPSVGRSIIMCFGLTDVQSTCWSETLSFFSVYGRFLHYYSYPNAWLTLFITAPAHPHPTWASVYPAFVLFHDGTHVKSFDLLDANVVWGNALFFQYIGARTLL